MKARHKLDIYHHETRGPVRYRYALGKECSKPLFVLGVNPSKATDQFLDPTVKNVESFAQLLGFESFVMLNLSPQRATDPKKLFKNLDAVAFKRNIKIIEGLLRPGSTVWAAWGDLITCRPYMFQTLFDLYNLSKPLNLSWLQYGEPTKKGHPRHPSRKKLENVFRKFDVANYLKDHGLDLQS